MTKVSLVVARVKSEGDWNLLTENYDAFDGSYEEYVTRFENGLDTLRNTDGAPDVIHTVFVTFDDMFKAVGSDRSAGNSRALARIASFIAVYDPTI